MTPSIDQRIAHGPVEVGFLAQVTVLLVGISYRLRIAAVPATGVGAAGRGAVDADAENCAFLFGDRDDIDKLQEFAGIADAVFQLLFDVWRDVEFRLRVFDADAVDQGDLADIGGEKGAGGGFHCSGVLSEAMRGFAWVNGMGDQQSVIAWSPFAPAAAGRCE